MGKYKSLARITVSCADIQLCADGTARRRSSLTKEKWLSNPDMASARESARAFGGASASAGPLIGWLPEEMRKLARRHAHNHIATRLRRYNETTTNLAPEVYTFEAALPALFRLDVSQNRELSNRIFIRTLGDPLQPTAIHIQGLRDAADAIAPLLGHRLQFRLHFCFMEFAQSRHRERFDWYVENNPQSTQQPSTNWLTAELVPEAGITLALQTPDPDQPQILFMGVEWRQIPHRSSRRQRLRPTDQSQTQVHPQSATTKQAAEICKGYGILKVAALFRPTKDLDLPRPAFLRKGSNKKYRPTIPPRYKVELSNMTPEQRLFTKLPSMGGANPNAHTPSMIGFIPPKPRKPKAAIGGPLELGAPTMSRAQRRISPTPQALCQPKDHKAGGLPIEAAPKVDPPQFAATPDDECPHNQSSSLANGNLSPTSPVPSPDQIPSTSLPNTAQVWTISTHSPHNLHTFATSTTFRTNDIAPIWKLNLPADLAQIPLPQKHISTPKTIRVKRR